jgi:hypothetical protein
MAGAGNSKRRRLNVEGEIREVKGGAEGEFGVLSFLAEADHVSQFRKCIVDEWICLLARAEINRKEVGDFWRM